MANGMTFSANSTAVRVRLRIQVGRNVNRERSKKVNSNVVFVPSQSLNYIYPVVDEELACTGRT